VKTFAGLWRNNFWGEPIMHGPSEPETRANGPSQPQRDDLVAQLQEKLRQAEANLAQVKATEERKRRRPAFSLAVAVLLLLAGAGASAWWYQQQQATEASRQERTRTQVNATLDEAQKLWEKSRAFLDNPASWQATLENAQSALKRGVFVSCLTASWSRLRMGTFEKVSSQNM
jgi:hypothetical protein